MQTTTIKLHKGTKDALNWFKKDQESYDHAIHRLLSTLEKKNLREELVEAYKHMDLKEMKEFNEWDAASSEW